ncbi:lipase family alpha/beta hydrolase [Nonomuraea sp. NPDC003560]|uniref:lipase family alpha/beta hydrolase n=1 Tax=Nonomuraea sp. NPDC003560 TaxID=3364341 RepID=UPI003677BBD6
MLLFRMQAATMAAAAAAVGVGVAASGAPAVAAGQRPAFTARPDRTVAPAGGVAGQARAGDTRPVVFVHGLHAGPGVWSSMKDKFEKDIAGDFPSARLHAFDYSDTTEDHIPDNAQRLSDWISAEQLGEVDVVSHSMGGLVARKAQEDGAQIRRIITLATPNHGTGCCWSPTTHPWKACQDMWRDTLIGTQSDFLTDLNVKAHITPDTVMTYAIGTSDGQVAADSVHLDGALNKTIEPKTSGGNCLDPSVHNSILGRDEVAADSMNFLRYGAVGVPKQSALRRSSTAT